jgi:hypothetical protein
MRIAARVLDELLGALPADLRHELTFAIEKARVEGSADARSFSAHVRGIVARYERQGR